MKTKELIEKLQQLDPDREIKLFFTIPSGEEIELELDTAEQIYDQNHLTFEQN
jgi:hypothetical protein